MWLHSPVMVLGPVAELVVLIVASAGRSPATAGREDKLNFHPVTPESQCSRHLGLLEGLFDRSKLQERVLC